MVAVGALLMGIVAYFLLPVAPLPQAEFPTIEVSAALPGASAQTMATSVATPLERNLAEVNGLSEMTSSSSLGRTTITLVFDLSKPMDEATQDVQTAISEASGRLPRNLPNPPRYRKLNPADFTVISLTLTSDSLPLTELTRLSEDFVAKQLARIPGVGEIDYHGAMRPAVRIQLDPDKTAAVGLTLEDVRRVIAEQTVNTPKGSLSGTSQSVILDATDQLIDAGAFRTMVVANGNGLPIHLTDVGQVIDAPEDVQSGGWAGGKPAVIIDIHKQTGYNVVQTIAAIRAALPRISAELPPSVKIRIAGDRTQTIKASVRDVQLTMLATVVLVVLVIVAFLQNLRATLIASITIPLSVITTFAAMYMLGYSLDNLSLMALTIAVSFVVDDAIVVIENIARYLDEGADKVTAAIRGSHEIVFTIVSMTISLIAVFIPILFMGGIIGRLFREFAVTVSIALIVSAIVSLTVTPLLCALMFDHVPHDAHNPVQRRVEAIITGMTRMYVAGLDRVLLHPNVMLAATVLTAALTVWLYIVIPKGFFPPQDTGILNVVAEAAPDVSIAAMSDRVRQATVIAAADPDVDNVYSWVSLSPALSLGRLSINLKPHDERKSTAQQVMVRLRKKVAVVEGLELHMQVRQDIQVGGRTTKTQYQYTLQSSDVELLTHWAEVLANKFKTIAAMEDIGSDAQRQAASATLEIDRTTASRLGVSVQAIDDTLYDAFGQRQVATIFTQLDQYRVILELDPRFQLSVEALDRLFVRSSTTGALVPLRMLAKVSRNVSPLTINHNDGYPSITLSFNLAQGHSLGEAVAAVDRLEGELGMPSSIHGSFSGAAAAFQDSLATQPWLILAALVAVYIVLGILYESAIHPLTIISTLPSAGLGALLALMLFGQELSIMGMIGIILLIGIVKKNAIMMIDFALNAERGGLPPGEAIRQGAIMRFRPIMMTSLAALLGALPLAFGIGQGAEPRIPLGIAIAGGLVVSQALTLYATPVIYLWFDRLRSKARATVLA